LPKTLFTSVRVTGRVSTSVVHSSSQNKVEQFQAMHVYQLNSNSTKEPYKMANHPSRRAKLLRKLLPLVVGLMSLRTATAFAQDNASQQAKGAASTSIGLKPSIPQWQTAAGGKMSFEVASVRQNKTGGKSSMNVDPTPGDYLPQQEASMWHGTWGSPNL
jgi:hypothetical protein